MFYNNRSFRLANMPNVQIAFSNSANPDEFAANVYKVMMTRNDNSVANAIDAMANSNSLYQSVNIKRVPELQELYKRVLSHNGPISQQDLANSLNSLFPNAVPSAEQQQSAQNTQPQQPQQQQPQQPQQQQSVSQMYGSQDLRNYQSAMDMQINSLNTENAYRMAQSYIATFQIYDQYLRQNNITDPNYSRYQASYKAAKKVQPRQSKQPNTGRSA